MASTYAILTRITRLTSINFRELLAHYHATASALTFPLLRLIGGWGRAGNTGAAYALYVYANAYN
jgi:hypothetical protein